MTECHVEGETLAGRPPKSSNRIEDESDPRLKWFRLAAYKPAVLLTDLGWHFQIMARKDLFYGLDASLEKPANATGSVRIKLPARLTKKIHCVRQQPIVSIKTIEARGIRLSDFDFLSSFLLLDYSYPPTSVRTVCFGELMELFEDLLLELGGAPISTPSAFWPYSREKLLKQLFENRNQYRFGKTGATAIDDGPQFPQARRTLLTVDVDVPNARREADWESAMKALLKRQSPSAEHELPELNLKPKKQRGFTTNPIPITKEDVAAYGILPYLDLLIWEREHQIAISDAAKARLLFPNSSKGWAQLQYPHKAVGQPSKRGRRAGSVLYTSWLDTVRSWVWSIMSSSDWSYRDLERRAVDELRNAYRLKHADGEFVPTKAMRVQIDRDRRFDSK